MSKGKVREHFPLTRVLEDDAETSPAESERCAARIVMLQSTRTATELRALGAMYLALDGDRVVLRRLGHVVATVITEVNSLRRCIQQGARFEADLAHITVRRGLAVRVRPVASR